MPVYIYQCECGAREEILRPVDNRNDPAVCKCGLTMARVFSPPCINTVTEQINGRRQILNNLNGEKGYRLPARPKDRQRIENALAKGLDPPKKVQVRGFGGL